MLFALPKRILENHVEDYFQNLINTVLRSWTYYSWPYIWSQAKWKDRKSVLF